MIKLYQKNKKKEIVIDEKKDFLASGGEGSVYVKNNVCFKIMNNTVNETKLTELMILNKPNIIVPSDILLNNKNIIVGFESPFVKGKALCVLFSTAYWKDNKLDSTNIGKLIDEIVSTTQHIHSKQFLIVDWNEMNFLVDMNHKIPYFIDTNAWKTPNFQPTAVTPLFQDHTCQDFNTMTDWYGLGILACKLYTGIHPFKGSHPNYGKTYDDTIERMKKGISIFNKDSKVPVATRSFDIIPDKYMEWFLNIFEKGKRIEPPNIAGFVTITKKEITKPVSYKSFDVEIFRISKSNIERYYNINNNDVIFCDNEIIIGMYSYPVSKQQKIGVLLSKRESVPYFVNIDQDNKLVINKKDHTKVDLDIVAEDFLINDHVIYIKNRNFITYLNCVDVGQRQIFSVGESLEVMPNSTKTLSNCFSMSVLGNTHFIVPWNSNKSFLKTIRVPELDGEKIVDAKFDQPVLCVITEQSGKYNRYFLLIDSVENTYLLIDEKDVSVPIMNFVVLDNGIGVSMDENGKVTIFTTDKNKYQYREIKDASVNKLLRLFKYKTKVLFIENNKIYSLKVK